MPVTVDKLTDSTPFLFNERSHRDADNSFRDSIMNVGEDTLPVFTTEKVVDQKGQEVDVRVVVGRQYGSWWGRYAHLPQDVRGKPYPDCFFDIVPDGVVAGAMATLDPKRTFLYASIRKPAYQHAYYLVYIRELVKEEDDPVTSTELMQNSEFLATLKDIVQRECKLYIVTGQMMSNCGRFVLFPKTFPEKMKKEDYARLIAEGMLGIPAKDLTEWSIVSYGYDARYAKEFMKANEMSKSLGKNFDYAPTSDHEMDGDESEGRQPYKTRSNRTNKRKLEEQIAQARGSFSSKLAKIADSRNFNLVTPRADGTTSPGGETHQTDGELDDDLQFHSRIADAMVFGGDVDSKGEGSSGGDGGGTDGQGSPGGDGGGTDGQGSSGGGGGGTDGQGSFGGGEDSGSNKSGETSGEDGGGNKENSSSSSSGGNGKGPPPRLHYLTNPKTHMSRPVHQNAPPPPDPVDQWMSIAYKKVLTPEQVYYAMTAVGPANQVFVLGYQMALYHQHLTRALDQMDNVTSDGKRGQRNREVQFMKVAAPSTGPPALMRKYLSKVPFHLPIRNKHDLLAAGDALEKENLTAFITGYQVKPAAADKEQEKPPETPISTAILNYLIQAFMQNVRRSQRGEVERRNVGGILAGALFCRFGFAPILCMRRTKNKGVPRFTGNNKQEVLNAVPEFVLYDPAVHAGLPEADYVKNGDGIITHAKVYAEYKANVYELCSPLVHIFFYALNFILQNRAEHLGGETTTATEKNGEAPNDKDAGNGAKVDVGGKKKSKENKLAQWVRNMRKNVCSDDLKITFSDKLDTFAVWKVDLMASYGEFMKRQVSLEEYVLGRDSSAVKSRVESVKEIAKKENATALKKFLDDTIASLPPVVVATTPTDDRGSPDEEDADFQTIQTLTIDAEDLSGLTGDNDEDA